MAPRHNSQAGLSTRLERPELSANGSWLCAHLNSVELLVVDVHAQEHAAAGPLPQVFDHQILVHKRAPAHLAQLEPLGVPTGGEGMVGGWVGVGGVGVGTTPKVFQGCVLVVLRWAPWCIAGGFSAPVPRQGRLQKSSLRT